MPKMPEADSKEETAESIAEKKEQVPKHYIKIKTSIAWNIKSGKVKTAWGKAERKRKEWEIFKIKDQSKRWTCKNERQGHYQ